MQYIIKVDLPDVVNFIRRKLNPFNVSMLTWVKILPLTKNSHLHGYCRYPKRVAKYSRQFEHGYQIRCSININLDKWPYTTDIPYSTWQKEIDGVRHWGYNTTKVKFENPSEGLVFLAGHEIAHFLRHSKKIGGKNTQVQADVYGLKWLDEYRVLNMLKK